MSLQLPTESFGHFCRMKNFSLKIRMNKFCFDSDGKKVSEIDYLDSAIPVRLLNITFLIFSRIFTNFVLTAAFIIVSHLLPVSHQCFY